MTNLSPATQSILDAFNQFHELTNRRLKIAAVLEALADQVVPDTPKPSANSGYHLMNWTKSLDRYYQRQQTRAEILTIAAELRGDSLTIQGD